MNIPLVSVIIAAPPELSDIPALESARRLDYPKDALEIIVARGRQPSVQRNRAAAACSGELIYFLDDDAAPDPGNLRRAAPLFDDDKTQMAGGPSLCPEDASPMQKAFASVMANRFAFGPSSARYWRKGARRPSSEKELILCNLILRKRTFLESDGFDETLYPNEENALMDAVESRGGMLIYDPDFIVTRPPRTTMRAFVKMLMNYGRGRAEQMRRHPSMGSLINLIPPLFLIYCAGMCLWALTGRAQIWQAVPLLLYGAFAGISTFTEPAIRGASRWRILLCVPLTHGIYGAGLLFGWMRTRPSQRGTSESVPVELEIISMS